MHISMHKKLSEVMYFAPSPNAFRLGYTRNQDEKMAKRFIESEPQYEQTTTSIIERWKKMLESYNFISCVFKQLSLDLYVIGEETRCRVLRVRLFGSI